MTEATHDSSEAKHAALPRPAPGPIGWLINLFSSIWLGVFLLTLLFFYCSIGSAGMPIGPGMSRWPFILNPDAWVSVREVIELSEFQWFHWWPFDVLIALICINLTVATIRRIPLNLLNLGVWMIHSGIIILALGSVWYFSTKVEGDAPLARRQVIAKLSGYEPVSFVAAPGRRATIGEGDDQYQLSVWQITPQWELLSGDDKGKYAYKVSVIARKKNDPDSMFIRELLANYPQYTEDLIRGDNPQQPFARAKKINEDGEPLVNHTLELSLEYAPQDSFFVQETVALYVRDVPAIERGESEPEQAHRHCHVPGCDAHLASVGEGEWAQRPIRGLPRFNEHISSYELVWLAPGEEETMSLRPLDVPIAPAAEHDPLPDQTFRITDYLPYANMQQRIQGGGDQLNPYAHVRFRNMQGETDEYDLFAFDSTQRQDPLGRMQFMWIDSTEKLDAIRDVGPPKLQVQVPEADVDRVIEITSVTAVDPETPFTPIEGTEYSFRVEAVQDRLMIEGREMSVAIVTFRRGEAEFTRWVFDDPTRNRDSTDGDFEMGHDPSRQMDDRIITTYAPSAGGGLRIVAGPRESDLRVLIISPLAEPLEFTTRPGEWIDLPGGISMSIAEFYARAKPETRPVVIPRRHRNRDVGVRASYVRLRAPGLAGVDPIWLPYHEYVFDGPHETLFRFPYEPKLVHLPDGRHVELILSQEKHKLPAPVVLEDFELETHVGGYAGSNASVRNWTSVVRFLDDEHGTQLARVSMNDPQENSGFWYYQASWDPPVEPRNPNEIGSAGLNYTILGVGNREGVLVQLAGCCIAVIGMIFSFYVKPVIKRKRQQSVYSRVAVQTTSRAEATSPELEPVAVSKGTM